MPVLRVRPAPEDPAQVHPVTINADVREWVSQAQAGDAEAFGRLYDRYVEDVYRFAYGRLGERQAAEDVTSETFLRALRNIGAFTWRGSDFGAWLVTIARNLVADHYRSTGRRHETLVADVRDTDRPDTHRWTDPEQSALAHLTNLTVLASVQRLTPEQRDCIVLRFLRGLSITETAREMGKNEGAIKLLQHRATRALRDVLPALVVMA